MRARKSKAKRIHNERHPQTCARETKLCLLSASPCGRCLMHFAFRCKMHIGNPIGLTIQQEKDKALIFRVIFPKTVFFLRKSFVYILFAPYSFMASSITKPLEPAAAFPLNPVLQIKPRDNDGFMQSVQGPITKEDVKKNLLKGMEKISNVDAQTKGTLASTLSKKIIELGSDDEKINAKTNEILSALTRIASSAGKNAGTVFINLAEDRIASLLVNDTPLLVEITKTAGEGPIKIPDQIAKGMSSSLGEEGDVTYSKFVEGADLKIEGYLIPNLVSDAVAGYEQKIVYDPVNKEIKAADFITGDNGAEYILGNVKFFAPAGSRIEIVDSWFPKLIVPENAVFKSLPSVVKENDRGFGTETTRIVVEGKNVKFENGDMTLIDGKMSVYPTKYILYSGGEANYKNNLIKITSDMISSYFTFYSKLSESTKLGDVDNSLYQSKNGVVISSSGSNDDSFGVDFLPGHEFLNVKKGDSLSVQLKQSSSIGFFKDENGNLKTEVYYEKNSNDMPNVSISNGKMGKLFFSERGVNLDQTNMNSNARTVPMEITASGGSNLNLIKTFESGELQMIGYDKTITLSVKPGDSPDGTSLGNLYPLSANSVSIFKLALKDRGLDDESAELLIGSANDLYSDAPAYLLQSIYLSVCSLQTIGELSPQDSVSFIKKAFSSSGSSIGDVMEAVPAALSSLQSIGLKPKEMVSSIEKILLASETYSSIVLPLLPSFISSGLSIEQIISFIEKSVSSGNFKGTFQEIHSAFTSLQDKGKLPKLDAISFIEKTIASNGKQAGNILHEIPSFISLGLSPEDSVYFIEKTISSAGKYSSSALKVVPLLISSGVSPSDAISFIEKMISASGEYSANNIELLPSFVSKKYLTPENSEQFFDGLMFYAKYSPLYDPPVMDFSKVSDKVSLGKTLADSFAEWEHSTVDYQRLAVSINLLHDAELRNDKTDIIRQTFAKSSDFKTKYELIALANADLYTSTFLALNDNMPNNVVEQIQAVDPNGEKTLQFTLQMANRNKLNHLLTEAPDFFREQITKGLSDGNLDIMSNTTFLTNSFVEYYNNPKFASDKEFFEKFLVERYNSAETKEQRGSYGFLLKLDVNTKNLEVKEISKSLPELPSLRVPSKFMNAKVLSAKAYYYPNEKWYAQSITVYTDPNGIYKMTLVKQDDKTAEMTKIVNGKTIRIVLTTDNSNVKEAVDGNEFLIVAHRAHSGDLPKTFNSESQAEIMLFLGSCGSSSSYPNIQRAYPNAYVFTDDDTGEGAVNNHAMFMILKKIAEGESNWETIKQCSASTKEIIFPHENSRLLSRFIGQMK